jgi:hypothetical protein
MSWLNLEYSLRLPLLKLRSFVKCIGPDQLTSDSLGLESRTTNPVYVHFTKKRQRQNTIICSSIAIDWSSFPNSLHVAETREIQERKKLEIRKGLAIRSVPP